MFTRRYNKQLRKKTYKRKMNKMNKRNKTISHSSSKIGFFKKALETARKLFGSIKN